LIRILSSTFCTKCSTGINKNVNVNDDGAKYYVGKGKKLKSFTWGCTPVSEMLLHSRFEKEKERERKQSFLSKIRNYYTVHSIISLSKSFFLRYVFSFLPSSHPISYESCKRGNQENVWDSQSSFPQDIITLHSRIFFSFFCSLISHWKKIRCCWKKMKIRTNVNALVSTSPLFVGWQEKKVYF